MSPSGVHAAHCCKIHGCKYGDQDCPVVAGTINQVPACVDCEDDFLDQTLPEES